ncbi:unnamed protein product, partial [Amoebophrya sp. A120]
HPEEQDDKSKSSATVEISSEREPSEEDQKNAPSEQAFPALEAASKPSKKKNKDGGGGAPGARTLRTPSSTSFDKANHSTKQGFSWSERLQHSIVGPQGGGSANADKPKGEQQTGKNGEMKKSGGTSPPGAATEKSSGKQQTSSGIADGSASTEGDKPPGKTFTTKNGIEKMSGALTAVPSSSPTPIAARPPERAGTNALYTKRTEQLRAKARAGVVHAGGLVPGMVSTVPMDHIIPSGVAHDFHGDDASPLSAGIVEDFANGNTASNIGFGTSATPGGQAFYSQVSPDRHGVALPFGEEGSLEARQGVAATPATNKVDILVENFRAGSVCQLPHAISGSTAVYSSSSRCSTPRLVEKAILLPESEEQEEKNCGGIRLDDQVGEIENDRKKSWDKMNLKKNKGSVEKSVAAVNKDTSVGRLEAADDDVHGEKKNRRREIIADPPYRDGVEGEKMELDSQPEAEP